MKKTYIFFFITVLLFACRNNKVEQETIESNVNKDTIVKIDTTENSIKQKPSVNDIYIEFDYNIDSIYNSKAPRMTQKEFNNLQLGSLKHFPYTYDLLSKDQSIYENQNGKIVTVEAYTGGERAKYLLSYNRDNKLLDFLLVSYEDYVEYFSRTSSMIKNGEIIVTEINYTDDSIEGKSDTVIDKYKISPELKFTHVKNK